MRLATACYIIWCKDVYDKNSLSIPCKYLKNKYPEMETFKMLQVCTHKILCNLELLPTYGVCMKWCVKESMTA